MPGGKEKSRREDSQAVYILTRGLMVQAAIRDGNHLALVLNGQLPLPSRFVYISPHHLATLDSSQSTASLEPSMCI
jgi:hypothetical protein